MDGYVKGSYTVEMALLSGVWLLVVFASLFILLGSYTRVWDTAEAYRTAVYENTMAISRNTEKEIRISQDKTFKIPYQNLSWRMNLNVKSKVIRPVRFIEKVQKGRKNGNRLQKKLE